MAKGKGVEISVYLDKPLPKALEGSAGFNLEFLPSQYWAKTYLMDGRYNRFPRYVVCNTITKPNSNKPKQYKGYVAQVRATEAQMGVDATETFDFDVLRWWQRVESEHPDLKLLVRLARYSLMSSASQFPVERLFSVMRAMLSKRQSMIDLELLVARVVISEEEALCGRPSDVDD